VSTIYFCTPTGKRGASSRYRVIQFFPYLNNKLNYVHFSFLDDKTYKLFKSNKIILTVLRTIFLLLQPLKLLFIVKKNDVVFIHRDIYPFGYFWLERLLKIKGAKIIFDLDDAIFLEDTSEITNKKNRLLYKLKYGKRYNSIIKFADLIICGNSYLETYCKQYNSNTFILPTVIDLNKVNNITPNEPIKNTIIFGWIGNPGNSTYFNKILPLFDEISTLYKTRVIFKCIGGKINYIPSSNFFSVMEVAWSEEEEYKELSEIDVGIMPLENSEWSKGKCGLKILQYMSIGKPTIADNVGVNSTIIEHGVDGFLADHINDWRKYIEFFVKEKRSKLVKEMGLQAKIKLQDQYSLQANLKHFENLLNKL